MKIYIQFLFLLLISLSGCEIPRDPPPIKVPQEMKEWTYFQKGTYWIYRNDLTNKEDSVWVDTSYINNECYKMRRDSRTECEEKMYVVQKSTFNDGTYTYESSGGTSVRLVIKFSFYPNYPGIFSVLNLPNSYSADSTYKNYSLASRDFNNVLGYRLKPNNNTSHWIAKNIGIIRWRGYAFWYGFEKTPCDLQLVRYKIVQ